MYGKKSALQSALSQYKTKKQEMYNSANTTGPLSGIGRFSGEVEQKLQAGLGNGLSGDYEMKLGNQLGGTSNYTATSNPWEAFMTTPAQQQYNQENESALALNAYSPQKAGRHYSFF